MLIKGKDLRRIIKEEVMREMDGDALLPMKTSTPWAPKDVVVPMELASAGNKPVDVGVSGMGINAKFFLNISSAVFKTTIVTSANYLSSLDRLVTITDSLGGKTSTLRHGSEPYGMMQIELYGKAFFDITAKKAGTDLDVEAEFVKFIPKGQRFDLFDKLGGLASIEAASYPAPHPQRMWSGKIFRFKDSDSENPVSKQTVSVSCKATIIATENEDSDALDVYLEFQFGSGVPTGV